MANETATLASGCFWCTEAIFKRLKGVEGVIPGYAGGDVDHPSYEQVSSGTTGHAEAVQIEFDPKVISYKNLLEVFFGLHDPTTLNRQGGDVGPQYRSAIFYHSDTQRKTAEAVIAKLEGSGKHMDPIVTEVLPYNKFFEGEDYHKNYYATHKNAPYCRVVIDPKIQKLLHEFKEEVKTTESS